MAQPGDEAIAALSSWERWVNSFFGWIPYLTLAISLAISQVGSRTTSHRLTVIGLTLAAALWTWLTFARQGPPSTIRQRTLYLYFAGFLVLAAVLTVRDTVFLVYAISGFFHASLLRPWSVAFAGIMTTGLIVHSHIIINDPSSVAMAIYLGVVAIQTVAVAAGLYAGERITEIAEERRLTLLRLQRARRENVALQGQMVILAREHGVLDERQRMAREIHDTIAQSLAGVITQLEAIDAGGDVDGDIARRVLTASALARDGLSEARRSVKALRPSALERSKLPDAIGNLADGWSEINEVPVDVAIVGAVRSLRPEVEVTLLRAVQEGLANAAKHAQPSQLWVTLSFMEDSVALDVRDDGSGFDPEPSRVDGSFGLTAMRQRVENLDGQLNIESAPGEGTAVSVLLPTGVADE